MAITALILAGGQGSRMGGADKGWVEFEGTSLIERLVKQLASQTDQLIISANRNIERYSTLGHPVVHDLRNDFQGPLAGIEAGLVACDTEWLLTCPVDTLHLPPDYATRMHSSAPAVASRAGRMQPTFMLLPRTSLTSLQAFLDAGGRKMMIWAEQFGLNAVSFDDIPDALQNLNDWQALQQAQQ